MNKYSIINLVFEFIETCSPFITLIALFTHGFKKTKLFKLLLIYSITYFILSFYANYIFLFSHSNFFLRDVHSNIIIYIIISISSFCFFSLIIEQFINKKKFRTLNRIVITVAILFFISNAIWLEGTSIFNSNSSAIANIILIVYCIYYYKLQLEKPQNIFVERESSFWIISGIFVYSAGNFFLFNMYKLLTQSFNDFTFYSWYINDLFILVMNIFFAKGIRCN